MSKLKSDLKSKIMFINNVKKSFEKSKIKPFIFLDSNGYDLNKTSILFNDFEKIITFKKGDSISHFFNSIDSFVKNGYWAAGYFKYEFGYYLEKNLFNNLKNDKDYLAWFIVSKNPIVFNHKKKLSFNKLHKTYVIQKKCLNINKNEYLHIFKKIKNFLIKGQSYQLNFTFKENFIFKGDFLSLYANLRNSQPTDYSAFIFDGKNHLISLSPELFFKKNHNEIICKPMKGTAPRGFSISKDLSIKKRLLNSLKNKSENLMIVDLIRNDLGKICNKVKVTKLFKIETYPSLFQMISEIKGNLKENTSNEDLIRALFPCGSVTGTPKLETMKLLASLEKDKRDIYTGAIGFFSPFNTACFNVPIRTLKITYGKGELGIGGGIVFDSKPIDEFKEAILKSKFFDSSYDSTKFHIIETILLNDGKYYLLKYHFTRLKETSNYFNFKTDLNNLKTKLYNLAQKNPFGRYKVSIKLNVKGKFEINLIKLIYPNKKYKVLFSNEKVNSTNIFLYHKTTNRDLYEIELKKANDKGFDEVLFFNEKNEITEGSFTNIFVKKNNILFTPKINSGILPGTYRKNLILTKKAKEKTLFIEDIKNADKVYVGNSVRKLIECEINFNF